ncbi:MAG: DUF389 domain-containing protein [Saprospiraceae bacterium]|nr:DUF389 domain-containing protein [Saprospiraceae bacterium]
MSNTPAKGDNTNPPSDAFDLRVIGKSIGQFFRDLIDLKEGLDKEGTIVNIKNNKRMKGANAWLLMCSIMIASLGLDLNSQAIIIGGMLISPLMAPILGVGLAIGTNDRSTLFISLTHYSIAIAIAVVTSTIYFFLTPFGNITEEILRRTEPTFLDVLVAFFGGVAGIISGSRSDKSNAIPGVAIATALMPPLCVTGFGIAKWLERLLGLPSDPNFNAVDFILNSFYLFHLNSFFVALATFLVVRHLRFTLIQYETKQVKQKTVLLMVAVSAFMVTPSFIILSSVIQKVNNEHNKDRFVKEYFADNSIYIDEAELIQHEEGKKLILKVYGSVINEADSTRYKEAMAAYNLGDAELEIISTSEIDLKSFKTLQSQVANVRSSINERLEASRAMQQSIDSKIEILEGSLDSLNQQEENLQDVLEEIEIFVDGIESISYANLVVRANKNIDTPQLIVKWRDEKRANDRRRDRQKIEDFFIRRTIHDAVQVVEL